MTFIPLKHREPLNLKPTHGDSKIVHFCSFIVTVTKKRRKLTVDRRNPCNLEISQGNIGKKWAKAGVKNSPG